MSLLENQKLDSSRIAFQTRFNGVLVGVEDPIRELAMPVSSSTRVEEYDWLGTVPGLTEWLDQRKISKRRVEQIQIRNKDFAAGVRLSRNDILDDRLGLVGPQIDELARKAAIHYGELIIDALTQGFVAAAGGTFGGAYDGASFFSTTHQDGTGPVQSNFSSATALSQTAYDAARSTMRSLTDEDGDPLGIVPNFLFVGPSNERTALEVTQAGVIAGPAGESITNVFRGTASVVVSNRLVGAFDGHWFLADLSRGVRPVILQIREPISTAMLPASGNPSDLSMSEQLFMKKDMLFGAQGRHNVGYAMWQFIHGSNG
jgi:phage major head subunit gpT-like protein